MANKFQALLALLGKNKQAQGQTLVPMGEYPSMRGGKAPVPEMQDPRLDGLNMALPNLPSLNTNATAQNAGIQTLQQAQWQQQHPLLAGIKKGANKAKHYLLDPVYNTPTGDATIDATDPRKLTDSRLGRFAVNALTGLAQQYQNPNNPLAGAFGAYSAGAKMRESDSKEYQARLGRKARLDEYGNWGYKPNPMLSEKQQEEGFKLFVENERSRVGNELLAEPDTTARIRKEMTPPQEVKIDPVTGKKTYTAGVRQTNPYAIIADPKFYAGKQQRRQQQQNQQATWQQAQQRIELDKQKQQFDFILNNKKFNLSQQEFAQKERQFQQKHGLDYQEFQLKVSEAKKQKPQETSQLERAFANGYIGEQEFVNAIAGNPRDKLDGTVINVPLQPRTPKQGTESTTKAGVGTKVQPFPTSKQTAAQKALLPPPKRTPQGGYQTSAGTLPAINLTFGR